MLLEVLIMPALSQNADQASDDLVAIATAFGGGTASA
mgnify:CR=1 FL=1